MSSSNSYIFTSESVSEGHPDKICDQISDAILDTYLEADPTARVALETLTCPNTVVLAGEVRGPDSITPELLEEAARQTVRSIGYEQEGFNWKTLDVINKVHQQSPDIAQGVDSAENKEEGAGDQGIMFGYATKETDAFMPAPIYYAHKVLKTLADARHDGTLSMLGPDAKSQISMRYEDHKPVGADSIVVSTQHVEGLSQEEVKKIIRPFVESVLPEGWMCDDSKFYVNPTGRFVIGGPVGDSGLTGRKIIVDTYGGAAPHGGGAFSGKDPTKVDRSAAYATRYLAKNIVAAGLTDKCTIQLSYAIGIAQPISVYVKTHKTAKADARDIERAVMKVMDLSPRGIREHLNLNRPIYKRTAAYGHFGRAPEIDGGFSWEKTDLVDALHNAL